MFQLTTEILRVKSAEDSSGAFDDDSSIQSMDRKSLELFISNNVVEPAVEDAHSFLHSTDHRQILSQLISNLNANSAPLLADVCQSLLGSLSQELRQLLKENGNKNGNGNNIDYEQLRESLEVATFFSFWFIRQRSALGGSNATTVAAVSSKKKSTTKKSKDSDSEASIAHQVESLLHSMNDLLRLDLQRIWSLMNERAPYIGMFMDTASLLMETEANLKVSGVRQQLFQMLALCVCRFDQGPAFQTILMQNLHYSTHLSEHMADLLSVIVRENDQLPIHEEIIREIGQLNFSGDDKVAKEFSKFLLRWSALQPREFLKGIAYLQNQVDSDSYTVRCAMIEAIGNIMANCLIQDDSENAMRQAVNLCAILEERALDVSSYCRARVFKTFYFLAEVSTVEKKKEAKEDHDGDDTEGDKEDEELDTGGAGTEEVRRNAIPLHRRPAVVALAIGRLEDKTSLVRKEAIRFLTKCIETHPFWLDGGVLNIKHFEEQLAAINGRLEAAQNASEDIIGMLRDALPAEARDAFDRDQAAKNDAPPVPGPTDPNTAAALLSEEEFEQLKKRRRYYLDAIQFAKQMDVTIPIMVQLLASKTKTDVVEAISFFVEAYRHGVADAQVGIKKMVHLIWSKDTGDNESKSVKEYLIQAYNTLYLNIEAPTEKDMSRLVVRNLIALTFNSTLADLTSLEQLLASLMAKGYIHDVVLNHLWSVYGTTKSEIPKEQRRGAIMILGMLAKHSPAIMNERTSLMLKIGLGEFGKADYSLARYTCIALQKFSPTVKLATMNKDLPKFERMPLSHPIFRQACDFLLSCPPTMEWFPLAEQVINTIYALAESPDILCSRLIRILSNRVFGNDAGSANSTMMAQLFFVVGHTAIKQLAHLEKIESAMKRHQPSDAEKAKKEKAAGGDDDELDHVVGSVEDEIGDRMQFVRDHELLFGDRSLFAVFGPMVAFVCANSTMYPSPLLQRMALLTLCKMMCISEKFCAQNLQLLLTILERSNDPSTRCNIIIALGDLVVCFNNLIDQNISYLYKRLQDADGAVKKNALMVLTHLILNGMVKVKGQISEMAKCTEDSDPRISDLAKLFFTELATKDNAVYNNLPDIISSLSSKNMLEETKFRNIMKFLFSFIEKDKQTESIVEKLCQRFKGLDDARQWRDISFCLAALPYNSEKSVKKLVENLQFYQDTLLEETVFKHFTEILAKARKNSKAESKAMLDDFEGKLQNIRAKGFGQEVPNPELETAGDVKPDVEVENALKELTLNTPRKKSTRKSTVTVAKPKPSSTRTTKKKPSKRYESEDDDDGDNANDDMFADEKEEEEEQEDEEMEQENRRPVAAKKKKSTASTGRSRKVLA